MKKNSVWKTTFGVGTAIGFLLMACSSPGPGSGNGILEPLDPAPQTATSAPEPQSPSLAKLTELFKTLGYEPIGMAYENQPTLDLLVKVFSDPSCAHRQIKLVYTGLNMAYDNKAQSLTVGGTDSSAAILSFIQKKVPLRP